MSATGSTLATAAKRIVSAATEKMESAASRLLSVEAPKGSNPTPPFRSGARSANEKTSTISDPSVRALWSGIQAAMSKSGYVERKLLTLEQRLSTLEDSSRAASLKRSQCVCNPRFTVQSGLSGEPYRWTDDDPRIGGTD